MQTNIPPSEPLTKSIVRGALGFGGGFALVYLLVCLLDTFLNVGAVMGSGTSLWNGFGLLHPTALAYATGAGIMGLTYGRRRGLAFCPARLSGLHVDLERLVAGLPGAAQSDTFGSGNSSGSLYIFNHHGGCDRCRDGMDTARAEKRGEICPGGGDWFNLGWVVNNAISMFLIRQSPYTGNWDHLLVGDPWYYIFTIVPAIFYGAVVGVCLGISAARVRERVPVTADSTSRRQTGQSWISVLEERQNALVDCLGRSRFNAWPASGMMSASTRGIRRTARFRAARGA